jgi:two-component system nitrogen regulation response regulator GlnG
MSQATPRVLVVDDEPLVRKSLAEILQNFGFLTTEAADGLQALQIAEQETFEVALVDLSMPGLSGMETIQRLKTLAPDLVCIILTGTPTLESSLAAIDEHVFAYLCKPSDIAMLSRVVRSGSEHFRLVRRNHDLVRQMEIENANLRTEVAADRRALERRLAAAPEFIGQSTAIQEIRQTIARVAPSDLTVLIQGESGTGKDVVARLIGDLSGRTVAGGFTKINCPAIPEPLMESELFGHEAGAFTGAQRQKPGRLELAPNGTVFLDEIGDLPLTLQSKLLQVIESKQFFRVGGTRTITINCRILAATNAPLEAMMQTGTFRRDLFYRLSEYRIVLPSLRQRPEDIPVLLEHFLWKHAAHSARGPHPHLSEEIIQVLSAYPWPGNVRELESVVRSFILSADEKVFLEHTRQGHAAQAQEAFYRPVPASARAWPGGAPALSSSASLSDSAPPGMWGPVAGSLSASVPGAMSNHVPGAMSTDDPPGFPSAYGTEDPSKVPAGPLRQSEIRAIQDALQRCGWNRREAAKALGTSYSTLRRKIERYDLKP